MPMCVSRWLSCSFQLFIIMAAFVAGLVVMAGTIWFGYRKLDEVPVPKREECDDVMGV